MLIKIAAICLVLPLLGCAMLAPPSEPADEQAGVVNPWTQASMHNSAPQAFDASSKATVTPTLWQHHKFPGKAATQFSYARQDGRDAMAVHANASASLLRQAVNIAPNELGSVRFSWKVPELIAQADMALREAEDSPVRIVLAFEGDRSTFSAKNAMLSELSHALTGEPMPYATLMYVWCNTRTPGTVIVNPRTDRIRKLVVESGGQHLNQWLDYERDIRADFEKAFGEPPGALVGIGIMTDTDNTHSITRAWYGPLKLTPAKATKNALTSLPLTSLH